MEVQVHVTHEPARRRLVQSGQRRVGAQRRKDAQPIVDPAGAEARIAFPVRRQSQVSGPAFEDQQSIELQQRVVQQRVVPQLAKRCGHLGELFEERAFRAGLGSLVRCRLDVRLSGLTDAGQQFIVSFPQRREPPQVLAALGVAILERRDQVLDRQLQRLPLRLGHADALRRCAGAQLHDHLLPLLGIAQVGQDVAGQPFQIGPVSVARVAVVGQTPAQYDHSTLPQLVLDQRVLIAAVRARQQHARGRAAGPGEVGIRREARVRDRDRGCVQRATRGEPAKDRMLGLHGDHLREVGIVSAVAAPRGSRFNPHRMDHGQPRARQEQPPAARDKFAEHGKRPGAVDGRLAARVAFVVPEHLEAVERHIPALLVDELPVGRDQDQFRRRDSGRQFPSRPRLGSEFVRRRRSSEKTRGRFRRRGVGDHTSQEQQRGEPPAAAGLPPNRPRSPRSTPVRGEALRQQIHDRHSFAGRPYQASGKHAPQFPPERRLASG